MGRKRMEGKKREKRRNKKKSRQQEKETRTNLEVLKCSESLRRWQRISQDTHDVQEFPRKSSWASLLLQGFLFHEVRWHTLFCEVLFQSCPSIWALYLCEVAPNSIPSTFPRNGRPSGILVASLDLYWYWMEFEVMLQWQI